MEKKKGLSLQTILTIAGIALRPKPYSHGYPYRDD